MPHTALHFQRTILPGGRIEVADPDLPEGRQASVFVLLAEAPANPVVKRRLSEVLAGYAGGEMFASAAEADAWLRAERDAWDS